MRAFVVAIMVLALFTGTVSSAACEMMCMPAMQTAAACCPHAAHDASGASVANARQCSHPQQAVLESAVAQAQLQALTALDAVTAVPQYAGMQVMSDANPRGNLHRSSFIPPLRI